MNFGSIPLLKFPEGSSRSVAIVGTGTSLDGVDLSALIDVPTISVNSGLFKVPFAFAGFSLDWSWYCSHEHLIERFGGHFYLAVSEEYASQVHDNNAYIVTVVQRINRIALSTNPVVIYNGETSGFGALQLATLMGFRSIFLFGFDHYPRMERGSERWHTDESAYRVKMSAHKSQWQRRAGFYNSITKDLSKIGASVINASPRSLIEAFPKLPPKAAIELLVKGQAS